MVDGPIGDLARSSKSGRRAAFFLATAALSIREYKAATSEPTEKFAGRLASIASSLLNQPYGPELLRDLRLELPGDDFGFEKCLVAPMHGLTRSEFDVDTSAPLLDEMDRIIQIRERSEHLRAALDKQLVGDYEDLINAPRGLPLPMATHFALLYASDPTGREAEYVTYFRSHRGSADKAFYLQRFLVSGQKRALVDYEFQAATTLQARLLEETGIAIRRKDGGLDLNWRNADRFRIAYFRDLTAEPLDGWSHVALRVLAEVHRSDAPMSERLRTAKQVVSEDEGYDLS